MRSKQELWQDFQVAVKDINGFPDAYICTFYFELKQKFNKNQDLLQKAIEMIKKYRVSLANDILNNGPMSITVKATKDKTFSRI